LQKLEASSVLLGQFKKVHRFPPPCAEQKSVAPSVSFGQFGNVQFFCLRFFLTSRRRSILFLNFYRKILVK